LQRQRLACADNQRAWSSLPERLVDQVNDFLAPADDLVDLEAAPHLIHADLTRDHLLGRLEHGRWITLGLIDFGDAMVGNLYYELVALHLDLFRCDKRLLRAFLNAYRPDERLRRNFAARAMTATLLHQFDVLVLVSPLLKRQAREIASLAELGSLLWEVDAPGLNS
jgi:hygromycin-B 7''-O-kinase